MQGKPVMRWNQDPDKRPLGQSHHAVLDNIADLERAYATMRAQGASRHQARHLWNALRIAKREK